MIPVGLKSFLFGVHQFAWHPLTVGIAWRRLYGAWPSLHEWVAIACHDAGYIFCDSMDGPSGADHPLWGASLAYRIVRLWNEKKAEETYWLALLHSRVIARRLGLEPSRLCAADKMSIFEEWENFYIFRAWLSGELWEYISNAPPWLAGNPWAWIHWYKSRTATAFSKV